MRKAALIIGGALLLAGPSLTWAEESADPCVSAQMDAESQAQSNRVVWGLAGIGGGFCLGCIGGGAVMAASYAMVPEPSALRLQRFDDPQDRYMYTQCYKEKVRGSQFQAATMGAVAGILLLVTMYTTIMMTS